MNKTIDLKITKPCQEDFKGFTPSAKGGFCQSCKKEVIDFSKLSETEIKQYFSMQSEETCGRFTPDQLKSYSLNKATAKDTLKNRWLRTAFGISIVGLLGAENLSAQSTHIVNSTELRSNNKSTQETDTALSSSDSLVKGIVRDAKNGEAIPFVNIYLKGSNSGTSTDFDGKFIFPEKLEIGDTLVFSFVGYTKKELSIDAEILAKGSLESRLEISLIEPVITVMGEVQVNAPFRSKPSFWQRIKNKF